MLYLITGSSSGFGRAIAEKLAQDGHHLIAVARRKEELAALHAKWPEQIRTHSCDLTQPDELSDLADALAAETLDGILLNAGGPPTMNALEATPADWNRAWEQVFVWKAELCRRLVPAMVVRGFGRVLFIESQSVQRPLPGMVLSNAVRAASVNYAKTLSREVARRGVTVNCLLPGSHSTPAIDRVVKLRAQEQAISEDDARRKMEEAIPVGRMGDAAELASLGAWLLGPDSSFVTGQAILHDGGATFG